MSDENPVHVYQHDGRDIAQWAGLNIPGLHQVLFEWNWSSAVAEAGK